MPRRLSPILDMKPGIRKMKIPHNEVRKRLYRRRARKHATQLAIFFGVLNFIAAIFGR